MSAHSITIDGDTDWLGFRREARALLARQVPPDEVSWHTRASAAEDLFASASSEDEAAALAPDLPRATARVAASSNSAVVPASFLRLCETVILHHDPDRFGLLYRLLWRMVQEPGLRHDPLDADRVRAQHMAQAVRRDMHKMKAFVRFRTVEQAEGEAPLHVAWFEPDHHIVEAVAPFFVRRFTQMRWAILTPERSMQWRPDDAQGALQLGPGARRQDLPPADAGEQLWLTYYRHIFNPARLKLAMMQKEMPRRYWRNLPEAELIDPLAAQALARSGQMIDAPATRPARRIAAVPHLARTAEVVPVPALSSDPTQALAQLRLASNRCRACPIGAHATQSVFGEGPVRAALMVVGEQPGDQEDLRGRPFVGPAGQLFERGIAELGWPRAEIYVTNAVKHFKYELRGQRRIHKTPSQQEAAACLQWLEHELAQVQPRAVVALGATAARALLGRPVAVMRERGRWHTGVGGEQVLVTLHPSALLRADPADHEAAYAAWLKDLALASEFVTVSGNDIRQSTAVIGI
ncbi:UdgX family uracil-DNA binding protein [Variovorax ginsengisoli]|uniref:Type-4 uracil-DNA glycosylase n=1 Tax=Variovorax ginsengisoli TaxID=363844 RepID=A0ABT9S5T9_9BURK|nr:UdgX family uracil-DNA binding protein [Variovorax ginsengisoli]MDP9899721.1 DNA polymerase [Variovorax ginsengisoli]